jgi:adenosylcobinamide kinase / adenosylcobinamide-phosphate guanylyltransferase
VAPWLGLAAYSCGGSCGFGVEAPHRIPCSLSRERPSIGGSKRLPPAVVNAFAQLLPSGRGFAASRNAGIVVRAVTPRTAGCEKQCKVFANVAPGLTLVLGGARSGKSRYAESLIAALPPPWIYLATAQALDAEMTQRIAAHRMRRGGGWTTIEAPHALAVSVSAHPTTPILVDCLTLWLSNLMLAEADIDAEIAALEGALTKRSAPTVLVANEVGFGIVPENALARRFRDEQGLLNQRIAALADHVVLMVAGLPVGVKGSP